ncbi:hypothetical protein G7Y79_00004g013810 [Physcia stellaris]|nr:hypothetical protein G7Y79_00004g013810 [Physcia stellaris]
MIVSSIDDEREIREWLTKLPEENGTSYEEAVVHMVKIDYPVVGTSDPTPSKARHVYTAVEMLNSFDFGEDQHLSTVNSATLFENGSWNHQAGDSHDFIVFLEGRHSQRLEEIVVSMNTDTLDALGSSTMYGSRECHTEQSHRAVLQKSSKTLLHGTSKQRLWPVFAYHSSRSVSLDQSIKKVLTYEFMGYYVLNVSDYGNGNSESVGRLLAHANSQWRRGTPQQAEDILNWIPDPAAPENASQVDVDSGNSRDSTSAPSKSTQFSRESTDGLDDHSNKKGDKTWKHVYRKRKTWSKNKNSDKRLNIIMAQENWRPKDN